MVSSSKYITPMDLFEKDRLASRILIRTRDVFKRIFHKGSLQSARWKEFENNLKPDLIKIKSDHDSGLL
jgi:hypothetical protein